MMWFAASASELPRADAASQGVDARELTAAIDSLMSVPQSSVHHLIIVRHGKVIAEAHPSPFATTDVHNLYSMTKTLTGIAVGLTVDDGLLNIDDKIINLLPESVPDSITTDMRQMTVRDLLTMTTGVKPDSIIREQYDDWTRQWLTGKQAYPRGTKWQYDSNTSYILSQIVQKVTGKRSFDLLNERVFAPMGITEAQCEVSPTGCSTGGWGAVMCAESQAKIGQLLLNYGMWENKQLLSREWVEQMTTAQIENKTLLPEPPKPHGFIAQVKWWFKRTWQRLKHLFVTPEPQYSRFWGGYGFQIKTLHHPDFDVTFAHGLHGQTIYINRKLDLVVVLNCSAANEGAMFEAIWKHIFAACHDNAVVDTNAIQELQSKLATLSISPVNGERFNSVGDKFVDNRWHPVAANALGLNKFRIEKNDSVCHLSIINDDGSSMRVICGQGKWLRSSTSCPAPYSLNTKGRFAGLKMQWDVEGSFAWTSAHRLEFRLLFTNWGSDRRFVIDYWNNLVTIEDNFSPACSDKFMFN